MKWMSDAPAGWHQIGQKVVILGSGHSSSSSLVHCLIGILDFLQVFRSSLDGGPSPGLILKEIDDCLQAFAPFLEVIDFADTLAIR